MLTALLDGKKIISTDPKWEDSKEELRKLCNNKAICPVCHEPVICKFGQVYIHHFAHSHRANCPGSCETEEHMKGKAILFDFLKSIYKDSAIIDMECVLPGMNIPCDIFMGFQDGRRWVVEFYCGHINESILKEKIGYYKREKIKVLWLISMERFQIISYPNDLKIKHTDRMLIKDTGVDKFYANSWYETIVKQNIDFPIPRDGITLGSLYYFSVKDNNVLIARAIKETDHLTIYRTGKLLNGQLKNIKVSEKRNIWYFKEEKEWEYKYIVERHFDIGSNSKLKFL